MKRLLNIFLILVLALGFAVPPAHAQLNLDDLIISNENVPRPQRGRQLNTTIPTTLQELLDAAENNNLAVYDYNPFLQSNLDIQRAIDGEINVTQSGYPVDFENEEAERTEARERPFSAASLLLAAACFSDNASSPEPDWYGGAWYNANRSNCRHFYLKSVTSPPLYFEGFENACLMFGGTPSELFRV